MTDTQRKTRRENVLAGIFIFIVIVFGARLIQLQIFEHAQWKEIAQRQFHVTKLQQPNRGEILDRNGTPLAVTLPLTYEVGYRPTAGLDFDKTATKLATVLRKPQREIRRKLDSPAFTYLERKVDWETKLRLEDLNLDCLQFDEDPRRYYPSHSAVASILGFTNRDGRGVEGIEAFMDAELSGEGCHELCRVDAFRMSPAPVSALSANLHGAAVTLTIDLQLQSIAEESLQQGLSGRNFERACAIMVDPQSGDILALATWPSFDPNSPGKSRAANRRCWPITDVYEPGSTAKIVPIALALETHRYRRTSMIFCENGSYRIPGTTIHDSHPHGELTLDEVLSLSSNIGAAKINSSFAPAEIFDKFRAFGFGSETSVGIFGEQAGDVPPPSRWSGPTRATLAFGQGMSCTALQLAMAYASIANGGLLMKPRLVRLVQYPNGSHEEFPSEIVRRAISPALAAEMTDMLEGVVETGTGTTAKVEGIPIAGKTGTAEKVDLIHKRYFAGRFIASFVGFFPANQPKYVLLIIVDNPEGEHYGGTVAAPIFKEMVEQIAAVRPNEFPDLRSSQEDMVEATPDSVRRKSDEIKLAVVKSMPATMSPALSIPGAGSDSSFVSMPFLKGLSMRSAMETLSRSRLAFRITGVRTVTAQTPPPGTLVAVGTQCELFGMAE